MNTDKSKPKKDEPGLHNVDPDVEARVDAMMDLEEPKKSSISPKPPTVSSTSAPLLPGDKLPDFDKKPAVPAPVASNERPSSPPANKSLVDDPQTEQAVDDIVEKESDRMLAIEDAKADLLAEGTAEIDRGFFSRLKTGLSNFWSNPKARFSVIAILILAITAILIVPSSRYLVLNSVGVRASTSMRIIDEKTNQPLKNVEVSLQGKSVKTDKEGKAKLEKIKLGKTKLSVKKPAFAEIDQNVVIGWGSNPKGDVGLTAVGSRYTLSIKDFVSDKPIFKAEVSSGEASASSDENGEAVLVIEDPDEANVEVFISGENYRTESLSLEVGDKNVHEVKLVSAKKHAFVSKRSGKYDLYKIDVDGKNEEKVVSGTGSESADKSVILPNPKSNVVAYVSNRAEQRNKDGFGLSNLMLVNLDDNQAETIDYSERIQLIEFTATKLAYVKIAEGESAESPSRHRLITYDLSSQTKKEITSTNYFNDVLVAQGSIYYAPAAYQVNGPLGLFKAPIDSGNKVSIFGQEVWNLFRVSYDKLNIAAGQDWYEYDLSSGQFNSMQIAPEGLKSRIYVDAPSVKKSAWVDERDGKGVLLIYDVDKKEDQNLKTQSGLKNPISWLDNDHMVYRVATGSETADYVISLSGGEAKKIIDVTNTPGLDRWYYY